MTQPPERPFLVLSADEYETLLWLVDHGLREAERERPQIGTSANHYYHTLRFVKHFLQSFSTEKKQ